MTALEGGRAVLVAVVAGYLAGAIAGTLGWGLLGAVALGLVLVAGVRSATWRP